MTGRILFSDPPTGPTAFEVWPLALTRLWNAADCPTQRRALRYRWWLRGHSNPSDTPRPECPIQQGLYLLELAYRQRSHCRGGSTERL